jgi:hypothetical protein
MVGPTAIVVVTVMAFPSSFYGSMAFPCDVLLVVIGVGIPRLARQCDGIMN